MSTYSNPQYPATQHVSAPQAAQYGEYGEAPLPTYQHQVPQEPMPQQQMMPPQQPLPQQDAPHVIYPPPAPLAVVHGTPVQPTQVFITSVAGEDSQDAAAAAVAAAEAAHSLAFLRNPNDPDVPSPPRSRSGSAHRRHMTTSAIPGRIAIPINTRHPVFRRRQMTDSASIWALYPEATKMSYKCPMSVTNRPYSKGWTDHDTLEEEPRKCSFC